MKKLKLTQAEIDKLEVVDWVRSSTTVCGVGFNDAPFEIKVGDGFVWQYDVWKTMLRRCFSEKFKACHPTYKDVTCCSEWLSFGNFIEWVSKEVGYKGKPQGYCLDKDLVIRGNKIYSPEACSFVPQAVNLLLATSGAIRGDWPVGVDLHKRTGRFRAQLNCYGKVDYLGLFDNPQDAFAAYKIAKEAQIKVVALQYKGVLKPAVYESLVNWEIIDEIALTP